MVNYTNRPINQWEATERPREKLQQRGVNAISDAELLGIILGSGTHKVSAIDLGRTLLHHFGSMEALAKASIKELCHVKGIGPAKAVSLVATFELGRRKEAMEHFPKQFTNSHKAAKYLKSKIGDLLQENFYVLILNRNNRLIGEKLISMGGISATVIDPKLVFKEVVASLGSAIIISHNHPSGSTEPSGADIQITKKLKDAGKLFDVQLLDHIIVSSSGYFSFADNGVL